MIDTVEAVVRWAAAAGFVAAFSWSAVLAGRFAARPRARASGLAKRVGARTAWLLAAVPYAVVCIVLWRPLPVDPNEVARVALLAGGVLLIVAGWALYTWGRSALGDMYNVSGALGSELYERHRLITSGPYRVIRHPMYAGIALGSVGALALYRTWALVFAVAVLPAGSLRMRREDRLLAAEFPGAYPAYRENVPALAPCMRHDK